MTREDGQITASSFGITDLPGNMDHLPQYRNTNIIIVSLDYKLLITIGKNIYFFNWAHPVKLGKLDL